MYVKRNFRVFQEIGVVEHHPLYSQRLYIQFCSQHALRVHYRQITYEVTLISSDHYKNSSVIVDLAMGQIPRSTERISSFNMKQLHSAQLCPASARVSGGSQYSPVYDIMHCCYKRYCKTIACTVCVVMVDLLLLSRSVYADTRYSPRYGN